ncbi:MAG: nitroreductase [Rhodospirillaceae bacterium]|nr:nitroreductase [Rhodospirillaceae bacterium]|tara:strand:- start:325 stop:939 length:615 start_codon:yes stop_codon:yes gene_type:complete
MTLRKPAVTSQPINPYTCQRWSPRSFSEKSVDDKTIVSLFEAARWSASCYNTQPWRYIIASKNDPEAWKVAQNCTLDWNRRWTQSAPIIGFVLAEPTELPGGHKNKWHKFDTGMACAHLTIEAEAQGLSVHKFAGIDNDAVRKNYAIPQSIEIVCGIVIGYQGSVEALDEDLREREIEERTRDPLSKFVFKSKYGSPAPEVEGN